jgi:hypothetical protein
MDMLPILKALESTALATALRDSLYLFPLLEATHVVGLALVFGTIVVIDFRLLGLASVHRPFNRVAADSLKWTWVAFAVTAATGALMFSTNAVVYYNNPVFRAKMMMLLLAGINMGIFEITSRRRVHQWNTAPSAPRGGKAAAVLSLIIWISIIFLGRWIGFTVTRGAVGEPPPAEINFDDLFSTEQPGEKAPPDLPPDKK